MPALDSADSAVIQMKLHFSMNFFLTPDFCILHSVFCLERHEEAGGQIGAGGLAYAEELPGGPAHGAFAACDERPEQVLHVAEQQAAARQIKEGIGEDVVASRRTEDCLYSGLRILTV